MGRPKLDQEAKKKMVGISISPHARAMAQTHQEGTGVTFSTYVERLILLAGPFTGEAPRQVRLPAVFRAPAPAVAAPEPGSGDMTPELAAWMAARGIKKE